MNEKKKQEIPMPFKFDDFFTTQEQRDDAVKEKIEEIDISLIDNFKDHPFKVKMVDMKCYLDIEECLLVNH